MCVKVMGSFDSLQRGNHAFIVYHSKDLQICDFIPFIKNGIENNELVMVLLKDHSSFQDCDKLYRSSYTSRQESQLKSSNILLRTTEEWFNPSCCLHADEFLYRWASVIEKAVNEHKEGVRLLIETNRFLIEKLDNALISFDKILQDLFNFPITTIYVYESKDIETMTPQQIAILKTCPSYQVNEPVMQNIMNIKEINST